tara:strand:- start:1900 stop:2058 length:159 start_codon:yes stop_codon:yes gene_type:complete
MTEPTIKSLTDEVHELKQRIAHMERVIDGLADLIRPKGESLVSQSRLTRWMR